MKIAQTIRRFFGTPKGLLIIILTILAVMAALGAGPSLVAPGVASAVITAGVLDAVIFRFKDKKWFFPDGGVLTGLIAAMILSPLEPLYVFACTSAIAIVSKHIFRTRFANVFNPAALGLVAAFYLFGAAQNWWGALGDLHPLALVALFAGGLFISDRVNKIPLVLIFLGVYFLLFTGMAFVTEPAKVSEIFRAPDLHAVLYFAFFILTDPPTSPVKYTHQLVYGLLVAIVSFTIFETLGAVHYLLSGVLVGNVWEAWRRKTNR